MLKQLAAVWVMTALVAAAVPLARGAVSLRRLDAHRIEMQNNYLQLVVDAHGGGHITSLVDKATGRELVVSSGETGLLTDWFGNSQVPIEPPWRTAKMTVVHARKKLAVLRLDTGGAGGVYQFLQLRKTITLRSGVKRIDVAYRFYNMPEQMGAVRLEPWWHNAVTLGNGRAACYAPTTGGIANVSFQYDSNKNQLNNWFHQPARGWTALATAQGAGLAMTCDFRHLYALYDWLGSKYGTLEWQFGPITVPAGEAFQTHLALIPFTGLTQVSGAGAAGVGAILVAAGRMKVAIVAAENLPSATLELAYCRLPGGRPVLLARSTLALAAGCKTQISAPLGSLAAGTYQLRTLVRQDGVTRLELTQKYIVGHSAVAYRLMPLEKPAFHVTGQEPLPMPLSDAVVTPHYTWSKPYDRGRTKVLFLMLTHGAREVIELAQCMDLTYHVPPISRIKNETEGWYPPARLASGAGVNPIAELAALSHQVGGNYDAIVYSSSRGPIPWMNVLRWDMMPAKTRRMLLAKVQQGTGLVCINPLGLTGQLKKLADQAQPVAASSYLYRGVPLMALPTAIRPSQIRTTVYGKGRVVFLSYQTDYGLTPDVGGTNWNVFYRLHYPYWQYYLSLLDKTILWAAHKEPRHSRLGMVCVRNGMVMIPTMGAKGDTVAISIRNKFGQEVFQTHGIADGRLKVRLPALAHGQHMINVWLKRNDQVVDWTSLVFASNEPIALSRPKLDKAIFVKGQPLTGTVQVINSGPAAKLMLEVTLRDAEHRLIGRTRRMVETHSGGRKVVAFSLVPIDNRTAWNRLRLVLMQDKRVLDQCIRTVWLKQDRTWKNFHDVVWAVEDPGPQYVMRYIAQQARALGMTTILAPILATNVNGSELYAQEGLRVVPEGFYRFVAHNWQQAQGRNYPRRDPCLSDPATLKAIAAQVQRHAAQVDRWAYAYGSADENSLTYYGASIDFGWSPVTLRAFRGWLKKRYGTLLRLNATWATSFKQWADVRPMNEQEVAGRGNYAPWADHRTFMDQVYRHANQIIPRTIATQDRQGGPLWVGQSGTQSPGVYNGYNYWNMLHVYNLWMLYGEGTMEKSLAPREKFLSWTGYGENYVTDDDYIWKLFLSGQAGAGFWNLGYYVQSDLSYSRYYAPIFANIMRPLMGAMGRLRMAAALRYDPVAILYSHASLDGSYIIRHRIGVDNNPDLFEQGLGDGLFQQGFGDGGGMLEGDWLRLLRDAGLTPQYVVPQQITAQVLERRHIKMVVLPMTVTLSKRTLTALEDFVKRGGVVVTDLLTGVMNGHDVPRPARELSAFLGLRWKGMALTAGTFELHPTPDNGFAGLHFKVGVVGNVKITTGRTAGYAMLPALPNRHPAPRWPVLIVHQLGRGMVYTLNFALGYEALARRDAGQAQLAWFKQLLQRAGVRPMRFSVQSAAGVEPVRLYRYQLGQTRLVGFIKDLYSSPKISSQSAAQGKGIVLMTRAQRDALARPVTVKFPTPAYVYDLRHRHYFGHTDLIKTMLTPGVGQFYALTPRPIEQESIRLPTENYSPGQTVKFSVDNGGIDSAANIVVTGPDNHTRVIWQTDVLCRDGHGQESFILALDQKPGSYTITATDAISDRQATMRFEVLR